MVSWICRRVTRLPSSATGAGIGEITNQLEYDDEVAHFARMKLYDLARDVSEAHDLAARHPDVIAEIQESRLLRQHEVRLDLNFFHQSAADQLTENERDEGRSVQNLLCPIRSHRRCTLELQRTTESVGHQHSADITAVRDFQSG